MIIKLDNHIIQTDEIAFITNPEPSYKFDYENKHDPNEMNQLFCFDILFRNSNKITINTIVKRSRKLMMDQFHSGQFDNLFSASEAMIDDMKQEAINKINFILIHMAHLEDVPQFNPEVKYISK